MPPLFQDCVNLMLIYSFSDSVYNATYVTYISDRLNAVDLSSYVPSLEIPEKYTNAMYNVHNAINTRVGHMLDAPGLHYVKGGLNEVYQQVTSAPHAIFS